MSEIRQDIFTGEWIIYATNRKERPYDFKKTTLEPKDSIDCSFCKGNESQTPNATYENHGAGNWTIRCFENKYPMVDMANAAENQEDFYKHQMGVGVHEVIVDTPNHTEKIHEFSKGHLLEVLAVLKKRYISIKNTKDVKYVQIFKNTGPESGASILHSHWQISGVPFTPFWQECVKNNILKNNTSYKEMLEHETKIDKRIVFENSNFIAIIPYAAKYSYEICIFSKDFVQSYDEFDKKQLESFAEVLKYSLVKASKIREGMCYNICFMDLPDEQIKGQYCWHARVVPRIGSVAGFEISTSGYLNPVLPEDAAMFIKNLD